MELLLAPGYRSTTQRREPDSQPHLPPLIPPEFFIHCLLLALIWGRLLISQSALLASPGFFQAASIAFNSFKRAAPSVGTTGSSRQNLATKNSDSAPGDKACRLIDSNDPHYFSYNPIIETQIEATLGCIILLFSDGKESKKRYGLKLCKPKYPAKVDNGVVPALNQGAQSWDQINNQHLLSDWEIGESQSTGSATRGAIEDKNKFSDLA
ncbi:hypothetical protein K469DRAFT_687103 [Zopfia rhizophila CBS 207.26]|uniref:Uncharacterized protein n=1 Tax=Zopfia rhizophila CBS 207.26 TaxID=1314779 RepID=A0A6A6E4D7_9PEZI|nr:hypothetical protein K469DRAFT_687103 [Zopfia rhizophila CBS 207.26]